MKRKELIEKIEMFDQVNDPAFRMEWVGQALNCLHSDSRLYLDDFDFSSVSTEKLRHIMAYINAAIVAERLADVMLGI